MAIGKRENLRTEISLRQWPLFKRNSNLRWERPAERQTSTERSKRRKENYYNKRHSIEKSIQRIRDNPLMLLSLLPYQKWLLKPLTISDISHLILKQARIRSREDRISQVQQISIPLSSKLPSKMWKQSKRMARTRCKNPKGINNWASIRLLSMAQLPRTSPSRTNKSNLKLHLPKRNLNNSLP